MLAAFHLQCIFERCDHALESFVGRDGEPSSGHSSRDRFQFLRSPRFTSCSCSLDRRGGSAFGLCFVPGGYLLVGWKPSQWSYLRFAGNNRTRWFDEFGKVVGVNEAVGVLGGDLPVFFAALSPS